MIYIFLLVFQVLKTTCDQAIYLLIYLLLKGWKRAKAIEWHPQTRKISAYQNIFQKNRNSYLGLRNSLSIFLSKLRISHEFPSIMTNMMRRQPRIFLQIECSSIDSPKILWNILNNCPTVAIVTVITTWMDESGHRLLSGIRKLLVYLLI